MPINISNVKAFIIKNIFELKSLKEVAAKLNLSQETLRKEFHRQDHRQISHFILAQRIEAMERLLVETDLQCLEICNLFEIREDSGDTTFKKVVGMTMGEYRAAHNRMKKRKDTMRRYNKHLNPDNIVVIQPDNENSETTATVAAYSNGGDSRRSEGSGKGISSGGKILPIVHAEIYTAKVNRKNKPEK